jgi:membrane protein
MNTASNKNRNPIALLAEVPHFLRFVASQYSADNCPQSAAALTYMSLFAVVPLMTVTYSILSAIPAFQSLGEQVQQFLFNHFVPSTGREVQQYLAHFSQQARKLTVLGVVILVVSAYLMLRNIESAFNSIWHTRHNRRGLASFLLYWAVLSLGPVLIGVGLLISTFIASRKVFFDNVDVLGLWPYLLTLMPVLLTGITFTLLFAAVPNCRVPLRHALAGGFVTAILFELGKRAFASLVANFSYEFVYGTFAAIPLFLLWIYFSWLLLLAGAEVVRAFSSYRSRGSSKFSDLMVGIALLHLFQQSHKAGEVVNEQNLLSSKWLFGEHRLGHVQWEKLRDSLLANHVIRATGQNEYLLSHDLHTLSLWELKQMVASGAEAVQAATGAQIATQGWARNVGKLLQQVDQEHRQAMSVTLAQLFEENNEDQVLHHE